MFIHENEEPGDQLRRFIKESDAAGAAGLECWPRLALLLHDKGHPDSAGADAVITSLCRQGRVTVNFGQLEQLTWSVKKDVTKVLLGFNYGPFSYRQLDDIYDQAGLAFKQSPACVYWTLPSAPTPEEAVAAAHSGIQAGRELHQRFAGRDHGGAVRVQKLLYALLHRTDEDLSEMLPLDIDLRRAVAAVFLSYPLGHFYHNTLSQMVWEYA
jgi:hypothetical protein